MTYRQLKLEDRSISYLCKTSQYTIPWEVDDPTTVHAEFVKGEENQPLEYGEEFTVDYMKGTLTLLTDCNNSDTLHIFEGEKLKYIAKTSTKHSHKTLTRRIDDCMEDINKIPPQIQCVEESLREEINKIPPKIDKVEKDFQEEIKNTATIVQAHSLSLIDQIKTLDEHEKRLTETATKEDLSNLKDIFVTPDELHLILENTIAKTQEAIKILEQEIKDLKDASSGDIESLKKKLENLVTVQEKLKKFEADIAEQITHLGNKTDRIEIGARNLTEIVSRLCQKVDHVDIIQMDRDVTALASKSLEVDKTLETLEKKPPVDLTPVETKIKALEDISETLKKLEETQTRKIQELEDRIKALEPLKDRFNSSGNLILQATEKTKNPGIFFRGQDGKDISQLFIRDGNLLIGKCVDDKLTPCIKLQSYGFTINNLTVQQHIKAELNHRTARRSARLHHNPSIGDVISGSTIVSWQYPSENNDGYLSFSTTSEYPASESDKAKRWHVDGKSQGYYGRWYWLHEVME